MKCCSNCRYWAADVRRCLNQVNGNYGKNTPAGAWCACYLKIIIARKEEGDTNND